MSLTALSIKIAVSPRSPPRRVKSPFALVASGRMLFDSPRYTLFVSVLILFTQISTNFFSDVQSPSVATQLSPLVERTVPAVGTGSHQPFQLGELNNRNTAYQFVLVGPLARQEMALTSIVQLRRVDPQRDIILHVTAALSEPIHEALEQLRVKVKQVPWAPMIKAENDFGQCCSMFWACWLKILTWNQTEYKAVLNLDTDFLTVKSMEGLFDIMAANAQTPFDVGGVADPVVAVSHEDSQLFDVFNGGMFLALPSLPAFEKFLVHAHTTRWQWGEMLWLNTFARTFGHWVRLPITYNLFPSMLKPGSPYLPYGDINWNSIYGLHFAGPSKVTSETSAENCYGRGDKDCVPCCLLWVEAVERARGLLAANSAAGEGKEEEAMEAYKKYLPEGWGRDALSIAQRNKNRGWAFDWDAWHDGGV